MASRRPRRPSAYLRQSAGLKHRRLKLPEARDVAIFPGLPVVAVKQTAATKPAFVVAAMPWAKVPAGIGTIRREWHLRRCPAVSAAIVDAATNVNRT